MFTTAFRFASFVAAVVATATIALASSAPLPNHAQIAAVTVPHIAA